MADHLEAKVGQFFTHQPHKLYCTHSPPPASIVVNKRFVVYLLLPPKRAATAKLFSLLAVSQTFLPWEQRPACLKNHETNQQENVHPDEHTVDWIVYKN